MLQKIETYLIGLLRSPFCIVVAHSQEPIYNQHMLLEFQVMQLDVYFEYEIELLDVATSFVYSKFCRYID